MRVIRIPAAFAAVMALVFLTAWLMGWSAERAMYLAPVIVVVAAVVAGLAVFWFRAAVDSFREAKRPKLILGAAAAVVGRRRS